VSSGKPWNKGSRRKGPNECSKRRYSSDGQPPKKPHHGGSTLITDDGDIRQKVGSIEVEVSLLELGTTPTKLNHPKVPKGESTRRVVELC